MTDAIKTLLLGADNVTPATDANPVPVALSGGDVTIGTVKIQGVNGVNIAVVDGLGNLAVAGNGPVQPDTAQTGSILTAGIYNSTPPTLTDGQQAGLQVNNHGELLTTATFSGTVSTGAEATASAPSYTEGTSNPLSQNLTGDLRSIVKIASAQTLATVTTVGSITSALPAGTNVIGHVIADSGSTTAVTQATAASLNATVVGTGTFATQVASATAPVSTMNSASANAGVSSPMAAVFDDVSPTAITENNFGYVRMSNNRNQYTTIRDAAGNERGVNVNSSNQLSVSVDGGSISVSTAAEATASAPSYSEGTSNPLSQTLTGNLRVTDIAAEAVLGTTSGAAVITDATGTIQQYLRGLIKQWIAGTLVLGAGTNAIGKLASNAGVNIGTVSIDSSQLAPPLSAYDTISSANAQQTCLPTDQVVPNKLQSQSNGATPSRVVAAASTNATNLKASAGALIEIDVFNVAAYSVFLKIYNTASSPTVGTDTPAWTIPIAAGTGYSKSFKYGKWLSTGVSYAITKLQPDSDTTAVAAGDLTGSIDWI